ncbi:recombinase [Acidaminobacter sp. JC074]|uniref:tyrosine-type recombinase/integrase n=1 Tax=Acidaminobacter sp. JC074 TaxID=2530199 RepID=UPI001F0DF5F7|nr:tyrosine-type recombinase/integrase [Acidaminobacter sp. JC074]MCH4888886.1 recombinase [Acidaminobacter sp. JC074]
MSVGYKIHNKSSKPNNIVEKENKILDQCAAIENELPYFLIDYFIYLKNAIAITSRLAYLQDLLFFCKYLVNETRITTAETTDAITEKEFASIRARDVNRFIGDYCTRYFIEKDNTTVLMENHNRSLSRKKSSLSVLFKFLFREEIMKDNIVDGLNPIKLPKPQPDAIKRLEVEEVALMLQAVETGQGLTDKERQYWEKTKYRDKAILVLFTTFGLRLKELQQLNISSFSFSRNEFKIYRKRGKEIDMPLNNSVVKAINDYIELERPKETELDDEFKDALFLSMQKKRITERAIRQLVKKYTSIALGTSRDSGYSPHKLRATAASSLIQYGFSIYDVQNLLDHDNVTTTQLYSAHRKNAKRDIIKQYELLDEEEN